MSSRELAYMTNEDFDLPRWQPQSAHDAALSSSHQAAQAAYLYPGAGPPPPPPPQSLVPSSSAGGRPPPSFQQQQPHSPPTATAVRQVRLNQLLDQDHGSAMAGGPYSPGGQNNLSRSASLGGALGNRGRRHRVQDDLEGAFHDDTHDMTSTPAQPAYNSPSFYQPPPPAHHHTPSNGSGNSDAYADPYFSPGGTLAPRRANTQRDSATTSRPAHSPHSESRGAAPLADPYSPPQQSPYSPILSTYAYADRQRANPSSPYAHSRSHSRVKNDGLTSPMSAQFSPNTGGNGGGSGSGGGYSSYSAMDVSTSPHPPPTHQNVAAHLTTPGGTIQHSISTPSSPLSYQHQYQNPLSGPSPYFSSHDSNAMMVEAQQQQQAPKRKAEGFRRVRDQRDLQPVVNAGNTNRRMDHLTGEYLTPLKQLTTSLVDTFRLCNPQFRYESSHNPRRVLTKPSKPVHNEGFDNDDFDYILYVNDVLGSEDKDRYLILDILGQGTFGQVVKCQNIKSNEIVAVKVVKNKPAYFNQSMMEVTILELLNSNADPEDQHHILRLRDSFIHKQHLCLVFELLSSNLYELIKQNQFVGLSTQLVKVFTSQLLDAMTVLKEARLIHCDLKPENILLKSLQSPQIKVIDFGSACHERQTVYTYIQSRFYRSPEVLLGIPYTAAIDMWSLGCIAVELFLGLPLFPGTSEYNQVTRIVEMLGLPPQHMLDRGKQTHQFFDAYVDPYGQKRYRLKSLEQYSREHNTNEQPGKQYFNGKSLTEIINNNPMPVFKTSRQGHETEKELNNRASFIDFCQGLLHMDPVQRWTPQQARQHPFITGEKWTVPWKPTPPGSSSNPQISQQSPNPMASPVDPKRPYGGLVASQPKAPRPYQDAAAYNQHLTQHQAYTAQQAAASQAASQTLRNPYISPPSSQPPSSAYASPEKPPAAYQAQQQQQQHPQYQQAQQAANYQRGIAQQGSPGQLGAAAGIPPYPPAGAGMSGGVYLNPNPPATAYHSGNRSRSNTINAQLDNIPPALARLQHMNQDVIKGRNALTPVMNRGDDALREWERRQSGKAASTTYPTQLEYLHQQAELVNQGPTNWSNSSSQRYAPPSSKLAQSYHPAPPQGAILVDDDRRDAVMSNVRSAARGEPPGSGGLFTGTGAAAISSPPQAYVGGSTANRYPTTYPQQAPQQQPMPPFEQRSDGGAYVATMQPDQYQAYGPGPGAPSQRHVAQPMPPSFYPTGVIPTQGANPAQQQQQQQQQQMQPPGSQQMGGKRTSGMDMWTPR